MDPFLQIAFALLVLVLLTLVVVGVGLIVSGGCWAINQVMDDRPRQAVIRWWQLVLGAVRSARARSRSES